MEDREDAKRVASFTVQEPSLLGNISIPKGGEPSDLRYLELSGKYSIRVESVVPSALRTPRVLEFNSWSRSPTPATIQGLWPRLHQLNLRDCSSGAVNSILSALEAPLLNRIEFHAMDHSNMIDALFPLNTRVHSISLSDSAKFASQFRLWIPKFPALESLELHLTASDMSSGWWKVLPSCATVENLVISHPLASPKDWFFLAELFDNTVSVPKLRCLRIEISTLRSQVAGVGPPDPRLIKGDFEDEAILIREAFVAAFLNRMSRRGAQMLERLSLPQEIVKNDPLSFSDFAREFHAVA